MKQLWNGNYKLKINESQRTSITKKRKVSVSYALWKGAKAMDLIFADGVCQGHQVLLLSQLWPFFQGFLGPPKLHALEIRSLVLRF